MNASTPYNNAACEVKMAPFWQKKESTKERCWCEGKKKELCVTFIFQKFCWHQLLFRRPVAPKSTIVGKMSAFLC